MNADSPILLDACVLVPRLLCDLFLRLAERPRLYRPRWSDMVLREVERNQIRLGLPRERAQSWQIAVAESFPESLVRDYATFLPECRNDPKDRHVLAAAIASSASTIVTFNLRDFPPVALEPWSVAAIHPSVFLRALYEDAPEVVIAKLSDIARRRRSISDVLASLEKVVPAFAASVAEDLGLELS